MSLSDRESSEVFTKTDPNRMTNLSQEERLLDSNNDIDKLSNEKVVPNEDYRMVYSWAYAIIHAFGGFYFGYAMTCMNNLAKPIIQDGLG